MKIRFHGVGCVPLETMERNRALSHGRGLPFISETSCERLAVIGGGHSIRDCADELKSFDGDRWIVAGAFNWCKENGIKGKFFSIDPQAFVADLAKNAEEAVLSSCTAPEVFDMLKDADVQIFDLVDGEDINHGPSTVTAAFFQAVNAGYKEVIFYGCDSSYPENSTSHLYEDAKHPYQLTVKCNGHTFNTEALLLLQAEYMATMIRLAPHVFKEKSDGLLRAMVQDMDYDITHATQELHNFLEQKNADLHDA